MGAIGRAINLFNRVGFGFNRTSKWNRIILSVRQLTDSIPVYLRTRVEVIIGMVR